ncbi:inner centromere protein isoform X4 [Canis lupus familiaris]|uniref:inner centromere protein isoform X4 n=1 Tax=Canis lupus familiaris TaxID=9615 RepID=UPI000DC74D15|nr:inner centromere protein isoform X4 [Canis lupus familiaris]XP_038281273.1 inner centromere protein isoform X4 [Canis lupus familiaris]XP_038281274.1 inner centromere protein isoform X4 [Canis lupus familiaris]XP_038281275.1 inner centromere protein isoform X4 [Canis lupus familiaris]XP_038281276.1 inner centromere protein isoform X4 [Canis lupus familiaris]XP_038281277.1 inner centromere protein isoform X4 [Canis lupus familiaris]XP_038281278.1 inner centromere protein isoform X4 [Canis l
MGSTAPGPIHLLELCDQKLMEFICNVDNKDLVWLEEIEEEAERMFTREFSKEPELMPKTPSQKNRQKKRRISYVQDENRNPIRKRLSRRLSRSSQLSSRHLRSKGKVEKLATVVGENGSVLRRVTRAAAAAAAAATAVLATPSPSPESSPALTKKPKNSLAQGQLVPVVEIGVPERKSAEQHLGQLKSVQTPLAPSPPATTPASHSILLSEEDSTPKKPEAGRPETITVSSLMATPQDPKGRGVGTSRSASKLRMVQASPGPQDLPGSLASPWPGRVLTSILPDNCSTPTGTHVDQQSVWHSLIAPSSPGCQVSLAQECSLVAKQEKPVRRSSRRIGKKATEEPAASARIICHSYLERLLNVEVPQKVGREQKPSEEAEPVEAAEPEVSKDDRSTLCSRSATKIAISTPGSRPLAGGQETPSEGQQEPKTDQGDSPKEPPQSVRRKRSYKQAVSELDDEQQLEDEELQAPRSKTPSPPCPASKVVRPLRTFLHTVQRNQMLMTPTSAPRGSVMKSFIKRNTPLRVDPKCSFVEKERQRLENLRRKEEAELLRRQKVEEDKRRRLEEVKLKREERLRKVLQARERVEQMKEEKKKQIEQKFAQIDEKTEKAKEERLAEEKAKKKAAAKKMEEVEARRKQEEEVRRLRRLQQVQGQDEEERRHQELLQKKKEEEQERLRKVAEAKRLAEQREQERQLAEQREQERRKEQERLQAEREQQEREREREKALQLQKERLQRELEEKKKKEEQERLREERLAEEQQRKAKEVAVTGKGLNVTVDVQSPACTSYQMTPQGHRAPPKINPDNYGMDLNSDDSTDDEAHPRKPIPTWARGTQLSQAIIHQYYHPPNLLELFGTILPLDLEDIFKKSKPRYHKRTSSAVWNSPPLLGSRLPSSLAYSLKKY